MDEAAVIAAAQAGDQAALETLLRAHYDRMHALALRLLGDRADAEDATRRRSSPW
jgi:RNA polymerase sigma-70 factor (ECF subfamily)